MSFAGAAAAQARREALSTIGYYNVKLGPTAWRFGSGLGLEYNTNIRLNPDQYAKSDFSFIPSADAEMHWPISERNSLDLNLGGGYQQYVQNPNFSRFYLNPGTELSFDFFIGDFWINLHDRASVTTDNYQDPTVVGAGNYSRLQNAVGLSTLWDMNKLLLRAGYDHVNYTMLSGDVIQPDGQQEVFSLAGGLLPRRGLEMGLETGLGLVHYDTTGTNAFFSDAVQWNVGTYIDANFSQYLRGRASIGYTTYSPDSSTVSDFSGFYAQVNLAHRLNRIVSYSLTGGRSVSFSLFGGTIDLYQARLDVDWNLLRKFVLTTSFNYEHGSQLIGYSETFDRVGPGIRLGRRISEKITAYAEYQYFTRSSDLPNRDYDDHILSLNGHYQF